MTSFVTLGVDCAGRDPVGVLRDHDLGAAPFKLFDDPVDVESVAIVARTNGAAMTTVLRLTLLQTQEVQTHRPASLQDRQQFLRYDLRQCGRDKLTMNLNRP